MGRIRLGEEPECLHASQPKYRFARRNRRQILKPSRRRPFGYYSILGVDPTATKAEIERAFRLLSKQFHPDFGANQRKSSHERSVLTKKFHLLVDARDVLLDSDERAKHNAQCGVDQECRLKSTPRVQRHRVVLSKKEKQIVSAVTVARRRSKPQAHEAAKKRAKFLEFLAVNKNNACTKLRWVLLKRRKSERKSDKRFGPFVVVPDL